jgi:hypothetical protein
MIETSKCHVVYNSQLDYNFPYITIKKLASRYNSPAKKTPNISREEYVDNMLLVCLLYF